MKIINVICLCVVLAACSTQQTYESASTTTARTQNVSGGLGSLGNAITRPDEIATSDQDYVGPPEPESAEAPSPEPEHGRVYKWIPRIIAGLFLAYAIYEITKGKGYDSGGGNGVNGNCQTIPFNMTKAPPPPGFIYMESVGGIWLSCPIGP